jgi:transposase
LAAENALLKQRVKDLTARLKQTTPPAPAVLPGFVKANTGKRSRRRPGRKAGHAAAVRPPPVRVDVHEQVAVPTDDAGQPCCPHCRTQLGDVKQHRRVVEDVVPARVITTCYHTSSGYCPSCRKRVESRAQDQPPPADLFHQFRHGRINALATAAVMRVCYRLPLRQITGLFAQLSGLRLSAAAIVKQLKRLAKWLEGQYDRLKLVLRAAGVVHGDETGWRTNGKNGCLWTLTNATHTLYHVDRSRAGKVIVGLLGKSFGREGGGKLVSDFYGAYDQLGGTQQKCLTHLLRELRDTTAKRPALKVHPFFRRCKRLVRDMLKLKRSRPTLQTGDYERRVKRLEKRLDRLKDQPWDDADARRLAKRLCKYRDKLTPFLHHADLDGTNNAAERALRPAVVMRKITGGSRSAEGAKAWSILASVMRTAQQQGRDVLDTLKTLLKATWAGQNIGLLTDAACADTS